MKIVEKTLTPEAKEKNDYRDEYHIFIDGVEEISANDYGEPEDNSLRRDLNFVYSIVPLIKRAYEAGKNGEEFVIEKEQIEREF
jgi:hypothetical protein